MDDPGDLFTQDEAPEPFSWSFTTPSSISFTVSVMAYHGELRQYDDYLARTVWPAARYLAQSILVPPTENWPGPSKTLGNRKVIELGAGIGIVGLVAAVAPLESNSRPLGVTLTDLNQDALDLMNSNVARAMVKARGSAKPIIISPLTWATGSATQEMMELGCMDTVVASDVIYEDGAIQPLFETAKSMLLLPTSEDSIVGSGDKEKYFLLANGNVRYSKFAESVDKISEELGFVRVAHHFDDDTNTVLSAFRLGGGLTAPNDASR